MRQSAVHFAIIRDEDNVTGAQVELLLLVNLPRPRLWELVTDVARYGEWSPECEYTGWLDAAAGRPARVGDRFAGRNRFGKDFVTSVTCVVTELSRPVSFAWVVLDGSGEVNWPGSIWRYELSPGDQTDRTWLRHSFMHGPDETGLRDMVREDPSALERRLAELRQNMAVSLAAMLDGERYGPYLEAKEQLAGYFVIDCDSPDVHHEGAPGEQRVMAGLDQPVGQIAGRRAEGGAERHQHDDGHRWVSTPITVDVRAEPAHTATTAAARVLPRYARARPAAPAATASCTSTT